MRELIIQELTQVLQEMARGFAHYLPRLIVMLILALAGWLIAYVVKAVLRSILRLVQFDRLSENAGASQLLDKAALPSATEVARCQRTRNIGSAGASRQILYLFAATLCGDVYLFLRIAGRQFFRTCRVVSFRQCQCAFSQIPEPSRTNHHHHFCALDCF
jgi:hypothetical protein